MSYWFGYMVVGLTSGAKILEGPFESYEAANSVKLITRGSDMKTTSIFIADSIEVAEIKLNSETWM